MAELEICSSSIYYSFSRAYAHSNRIHVCTRSQVTTRPPLPQTRRLGIRNNIRLYALRSQRDPPNAKRRYHKIGAHPMSGDTFDPPWSCVCDGLSLCDIVTAYVPREFLDFFLEGGRARSVRSVQRFKWFINITKFSRRTNAASDVLLVFTELIFHW